MKVCTDASVSMLIAALAFVTTLFVRHGDVNAEARMGLEAFEDFDWK